MNSLRHTPPKFVVSDNLIWGFSRHVPNAANTTSLEELAEVSKRIVIAWALSENLRAIVEAVRAAHYHIHQPPTHAEAIAPGATFFICAHGVCADGVIKT